MLVALPLAAGFIVRLAIGRWWALAVPVAAGVWAGLTSELEVDPVWIGGMIGLIGAVGTTAGVLVRRRLRR